MCRGAPTQIQSFDPLCGCTSRLTLSAGPALSREDQRGMAPLLASPPSSDSSPPQACRSLGGGVWGPGLEVWRWGAGGDSVDHRMKRRLPWICRETSVGALMTLLGLKGW